MKVGRGKVAGRISLRDRRAEENRSTYKMKKAHLALGDCRPQAKGEYFALCFKGEVRRCVTPLGLMTFGGAVEMGQVRKKSTTSLGSFYLPYLTL